MLGRYRMGNDAKANEYWRREEEKLCRACKEGPEMMKHVLMDALSLAGAAWTETDN